MSQITLSINLRQLKHSIVKGRSGQNVICIPVDDNNLYHSERGEYLNLVAFEVKNQNPAYKNDTHILRQSLPKSKYETMTEEERRAMPIVGNMSIGRGQTEQQAESLADLPY